MELFCPLPWQGAKTDNSSTLLRFNPDLEFVVFHKRSEVKYLQNLNFRFSELVVSGNRSIWV